MEIESRKKCLSVAELAVNLLPSLLVTYLLPIPYIKKCCWALTGNVFKTTRGKLLKSCQGIFQKKSIKLNFRFHNETYVLLILHIQININRKKCIIVVVLIFLSSSQYLCPKILKTQLPWFWPSYATAIIYLMNNICLYKFENLQKNGSFL